VVALMRVRDVMILADVQRIAIMSAPAWMIANRLHVIPGAFCNHHLVRVRVRIVVELATIDSNEFILVVSDLISGTHFEWKR
jgi:hypothetical protein